MIEAVLWDLGGVLCHFHPERRVQAIARASGVGVRVVRSLLTSDFLGRLDDGRMSEAQLVAEIDERLGWRCGAPELGRAWAAAFDPNIAVVEVARRTTVPAAVLTNNGPPLSDHYAELLPAVAEAVPAAFFSGRTARVKPHRAAFLGACAALAVEPAHVLLVDDSSTNIAAAAACGLRTHQFLDAPELLQAFHDGGLLGDG